MISMIWLDWGYRDMYWPVLPWLCYCKKLRECQLMCVKLLCMWVFDRPVGLVNNPVFPVMWMREVCYQSVDFVVIVVVCFVY